jgi:hypothetical protein
MQGGTMGEELELIELTRLASEGDPSILIKMTADWIAYFRPDKDDRNWGQMLIREREPPHFRLGARRMLRAEFDAME